MRKKPSVLHWPEAGQEHQLDPSLHPVLQRILVSRGISDEQDLLLGFPQLARPDSLGGLNQAAALLADAVCQNRRILVVGDFDADGATGTALAVKVLQAMGSTGTTFAVPNRFEFGYGLSAALVETLRDNPPDLLMTVDSGIACLEGVALARDLGIEVVVTDHHLPGPELPEAHAIVNPNCPGDDFPSKALAGVGVVFYLLTAVRSVLNQRGWFNPARPSPRLADYLDLVALGTVADVVPMDQNNRILVAQGLKRLRAGAARPGLLALLRLAKRDYRQARESDLGFAVAPRLNAAGRLEDMSVGIQCLLTDDRERAQALAETLDQLNLERRRIQERMTESAQQQLEPLLETVGDEPVFSLCLYQADWHQGIVGLVASRIKDARHCPVVAFAHESEGSDLLKGSVRSISGVHIRDVLAHVDAQHPDLIEAFGGHAMAAGLTLQHAHLGRFEEAFEASVKHFLEGQLPRPEVYCDGQLDAAELNLEFAQQLRSLGPWGQKFPEPLFEGQFEIIEQRVVGGAHLKMVLRSTDGEALIDAIAFRTLPEQLQGARRVYLLYRLDVNHFRGESSAQLMVEHISAC